MDEEDRQHLRSLAKVVDSFVAEYDDAYDSGSPDDVAAAARTLRHAAVVLGHQVLAYV